MFLKKRIILFHMKPNQKFMMFMFFTHHQFYINSKNLNARTNYLP